MLYDIVRKLPDGAQVSLEMTGDMGQMLIRSGRSRFMLQALPESDFPDLAAGDLPHRFTLPAADLKRLIEKTQFAISTEETRYYLNGIYLHTHRCRRHRRCCAPSPPTATASPASRSRRRTARRACPASSSRARRWPRSSSSSRTAGDDVAIELSAAKIRFTFGGVVLTSKLIDGTFPDYQRVIPAGNDKVLVVERARFREGGRPRLDHLVASAAAP